MTRPWLVLLFFYVWAIIAGVFVGIIPIETSLLSVMIFAGPHNALEARYVLCRLPGRIGKLTPFFRISVAGVVLLSLSYILLSFTTYLLFESIWLSLLWCWIAKLIIMRSRTNPRFEADWVWPMCFGAIAMSWYCPDFVMTCIAFAHPIMALAILDLELARRYREWQKAFRFFSLLIILFVVASVLMTSNAKPQFQDGISTELPGLFFGTAGIAIHAYLELLHYSIWVLILPMLTLRESPWKWHLLLRFKETLLGQRLIVIAVILWLLAIICLWACFVVEYSTTRQVYFIIAIFHVLAEVPLYLRLLSPRPAQQDVELKC